MKISSDSRKGVPIATDAPSAAALGKDLASLTHNLMGSVSALLMCEHMIGTELGPSQEVANNPTLQTTLRLLKETADQIREYGEDLMKVSNTMARLDLAKLDGPLAVDKNHPTA